MHSDSGFPFVTVPDEVGTLPLDKSLKAQFRRQGEFNTRLPVFFLRGIVHLATRFLSFRLYDGNFSERYLRINTGSTKLGIRIIRPDTTEKLPAVLYFHGGGGVLADSASYIRVLKNIACYSNAVVVAVDYRRAPEFRFPAPLEDAVAALQWLYQHAAELEIDQSKIRVAGDSAGGTIAAGLCLYNRDHEAYPIAGQILINPITDQRANTVSRQQFAKGYGLTAIALQYFEDQCFENEEDMEQIYASPLRCHNLSGLPPALVITSEYDPLRDEGELYGKAMHEAGVQVKTVRYLGMAHTLMVFGATRETAKDALERISREINH